MIAYRPAGTISKNYDDSGNFTKNYIRKTDSHVPLVSISHTQIKLLNLLKNWFGGSISISKAKSNGKNWKTLYRWIVKGSWNVKKFLELIQPYLFLKRRHAEILIELVSTFNKYGQSFPPPTPEIIERRRKLHKEIRFLNRRGLHPQRLNEQNEEESS